MALIAPYARMTRSTNRSTAKRRSSLVPLLSVTSLGILSPRPRERIARLRLKAWHGLFCWWMREEAGSMTAEYPQGDEPLIPMPVLSLPALRQAVATVAPSRLPEFFEEIQDAFTQAGDE